MNKLLKKFITDQKIPIQPISDPEYLDYALGLFGAQEAWKKAVDLVNTRFGGNEDSFICEVGTIREHLISLVSSTEGYSNFQKDDMNKYAIKPIPGVRSDGVYKENLVNKEYTSIDLAEAGWQVLRKYRAAPDLGWKEFIKKETDIDYLIDSKQFREVILGNLNPKRQRTVERWMINEIRESLPEIKDRLISQGDDEVIYSGKVESVEEIRKKYPNCHVKQFTLRGYRLVLEGAGSVVFFGKESPEGEMTYHCVPSMYYLPITKLIRGQEIIDKDLLFLNQDKVLCKYLGSFKLTKL